MSELTKPPEQIETTSEEEFPPLQDDPTMPGPDESMTSPAEPASPASTTESTTPSTLAEALTAPKPDPWAETEPVAPVAPEPAGSPLLLVSVIVALAAAAVIFLAVRNHALQAQLDQEKNLAAQLQAQVDHPPLPSANSPAFSLVSAVYGTGAHFADVTDRVGELLRQSDGDFSARPDSLHQDPSPGWNKELIILYRYQGRNQIFTTGEGGQVSLARLTHETSNLQAAATQ